MIDLKAEMSEFFAAECLAAENLVDVVHVITVLLSYSLLLKNVKVHVGLIAKIYDWQDAETLLFEMIGVNKPIRASMEMEKSMFTEEKTNAEVLIGAYYFTELIQKIKQMSLNYVSMKRFWFNVL